MLVGELIQAQVADYNYRLISVNHNIIWDDKGSEMPQVFYTSKIKYIRPHRDGFEIWLGGK